MMIKCFNQIDPDTLKLSGETWVSIAHVTAAYKATATTKVAKVEVKNCTSLLMSDGSVFYVDLPLETAVEKIDELDRLLRKSTMR